MSFTRKIDRKVQRIAYASICQILQGLFFFYVDDNEGVMSGYSSFLIFFFLFVTYAKRDHLMSSLYCQLCPSVAVPEVNSHCTTKITSENHCDNVHKFLPCAKVPLFTDSRSASERIGV